MDQGTLVAEPQQEVAVTPVVQVTTDEQEVQGRLKQMLGAHGHLRFCGLTFTFHEGLVTVHGTLRTWHQKQHISHAFSGVEGVTQVIDQTEVVPDEPRGSELFDWQVPDDGPSGDKQAD